MHFVLLIYPPVAFTASLKYYLGLRREMSGNILSRLLVWSIDFFSKIKRNLFFQKKQNLFFFQTKFIWVGAGSGLGLGLGSGQSFFFAEKSVDHAKSHDTILPDYHTLS